MVCLTFLLFAVAAVVIVFTVMGNWLLFQKAGRPGWESIIPIYSGYIIYKLYWGNGWLFLMPCALACMMQLPYIGSFFGLLLLIVRFLTVRKKALAYGYHGILFAGLLYFFDLFVSLVMGVSEDHPYMGVPRDGLSYDELKAKLGKR